MITISGVLFDEYSVTFFPDTDRVRIIRPVDIRTNIDGDREYITRVPDDPCKSCNGGDYSRGYILTHNGKLYYDHCLYSDFSNPEYIGDVDPEGEFREEMHQKTVIITRHPGAVRWLESIGITGEIVPHFSGDVLKGALYVGVLPLPMIKTIIDQGGQFLLLSLPGVAFGERGQELSPDEMTAAGATLHDVRGIELEEVRIW